MNAPAGASMESVLAAWLPGQRWYPAKGRAVSMRVLADLTLADPAHADMASSGSGGDGTRVSVVIVDLGLGEDLASALQVPIVARREPVPGRPEGFIGLLATSQGPRHLYDGPHDAAYVEVLAVMLRERATVRCASGWVASVPTTMPESVTAPPAASRVLSGEQSNTSVITTFASGAGSIIKIFRSLQSGENPDITLQTALAAAGSTRVPAPIGYVRGGWTDPHGRPVVADLAFASEFLPDAPDAWRTATVAVERGRGFEADALDLGAATAEVHLALASALPSEPATADRLAALAASLSNRIRWAVEAAPELARYADGARAVVAAVTRVSEAPDWQRIHGDLHLGQVLRPPGRGWVLLDFEGEPLRPLPERIALDTPLRDVAGMLRSFDYAARRVTVGLAPGPATDAAIERADAWATAARDAYCRGYAAVSGRDPRSYPIVLAALELEKALYEVVYETRNRPSWLPIPLHAVARLLG